MEKRTCGYHSCRCRGVSFISRGGVVLDSSYCVDGKRVRVKDDGAVYAFDLTAADVAALSNHFLNKYAEYCAWHSKQKAEKPEVYGDMVLQPFDLGGSSWPLRWDDKKWLVDLFAQGEARAAEDARGANLFCISDAELAEERALLSPAELAAVNALPKPE